jgi:hypothetical protein
MESKEVKEKGKNKYKKRKEKQKTFKDINRDSVLINSKLNRH